MATIKRLLFLSFLCFCASFDVFSMEKQAGQVPDQALLKEITDVRDSKLPVNNIYQEELLQKVGMLCRINDKTYRAVQRITHPDNLNRIGKDIVNVKIMEEINKRASTSREVAEVKLEPLTPIDKKRHKILDRKDMLKKKTKGYRKALASIPAELLDINMIQAQQDLLHSFINNVIQNIFTLISDKFIMARYPKDTIDRKYVTILSHNKEVKQYNRNFLAIELEMQKEYETDLKKIKNNYDNAIQRKLKRLL